MSQFNIFFFSFPGTKKRIVFRLLFPYNCPGVTIEFFSSEKPSSISRENLRSFVCVSRSLVMVGWYSSKRPRLPRKTSGKSKSPRCTYMIIDSLRSPSSSSSSSSLRLFRNLILLRMIYFGYIVFPRIYLSLWVEEMMRKWRKEGKKVDGWSQKQHPKPHFNWMKMLQWKYLNVSSLFYVYYSAFRIKRHDIEDIRCGFTK